MEGLTSHLQVKVPSQKGKAREGPSTAPTPSDHQYVKQHSSKVAVMPGGGIIPPGSPGLRSVSSSSSSPNNGNGQKLGYVSPSIRQMTRSRIPRGIHHTTEPYKKGFSVLAAGIPGLIANFETGPFAGGRLFLTGTKHAGDKEWMKMTACSNGRVVRAFQPKSGDSLVPCEKELVIRCEDSSMDPILGYWHLNLEQPNSQQHELWGGQLFSSKVAQVCHTRREQVKDAFDFIAEGLRDGQSVLVHCRAGVNRSATLVIAFLMLYNSMNFDDAFTVVLERSLSGSVVRNEAFMLQLFLLQKEIQISIGKSSLTPENNWRSIDSEWSNVMFGDQTHITSASGIPASMLGSQIGSPLLPRPGSYPSTPSTFGSSQSPHSPAQSPAAITAFKLHQLHLLQQRRVFESDGLGTPQQYLAVRAQGESVGGYPPQVVLADGGQGPSGLQCRMSLNLGSLSPGSQEECHNDEEAESGILGGAQSLLESAVAKGFGDSSLFNSPSAGDYSDVDGNERHDVRVVSNFRTIRSSVGVGSSDSDAHPQLDQDSNAGENLSPEGQGNSAEESSIIDHALGWAASLWPSSQPTTLYAL